MLNKLFIFIVFLLSTTTFYLGLTAFQKFHATPQYPQTFFKTSKNFSGLASWYGIPFHGRLTANGERYNMYDLTAAHKTLKLGTYLEITNLYNNKKIIVKVNDRGPYIRGRSLDLSYGAAKELGFVNRGLIKYKARILKKVDMFKQVKVAQLKSY